MIEIIGLILGIISAIAAFFFFKDKFIPYKRISWRYAEKSTERISQQMIKDEFIPTLILGIGRGGAVMGSLISGVLGHKSLCVIDREYTWVDGRRKDDMLLHTTFPSEVIEKVLLVAGEVHTGNTMRKYYEYLKNIGAKDVRRATLLFEKGSTEPVEYKGIETHKDLRLPWMFTEKYLRGDRREEAEKCNIKKVFFKGEKAVFLIRHGESVDNAAGDRFSGITDSELSELGRQQAEKIGKKLRHCSTSYIVTSPMKRAKDTARLIHEYTGGDIYIDNRLKEINYGDWEGLTKDEVSNKYPDIYERWNEDPALTTPPNAEMAEDALNRAYSYWKELESRMIAEGINIAVVVAHKTIIRLLLCHLQNLPIKDYRGIHLPNSSITIISIDHHNKANVSDIGDTSHLMQ
jgi:probable phosphoglycerate mutase